MAFHVEGTEKTTDSVKPPHFLPQNYNYKISEHIINIMVWSMPKTIFTIVDPTTISTLKSTIYTCKIWLKSTILAQKPKMQYTNLQDFSQKKMQPNLVYG